MRITVAVCTRNRSEQLRGTLEQMTRLVIPPRTDWEVLVVNNGSTDATEAVLAAVAPRLPLRCVRQPTPGLSQARNLAARAAAGDYILWTDDDVRVAPGWLTAYHTAFERWPDAAIFGGPIAPVFLGTPPPWLTRVRDRVGSAYAQREVGAGPAPIVGTAPVPFGANMAVRTREQRRHLFDTRLGLQPHSRMGGEDTTCLRGLLAAGAAGWWVPAARVEHLVLPERQTIAYLWRYYYGQGEFAARTAPPAAAARLLGRPRWLWRQLVAAELRYRLRRVVCRPELWIEDLIQASYSWGMVQSMCRPGGDLRDPRWLSVHRRT